MILSRRKAHFYIVSALCCILPVVAIAALLLRPSVPLVEEDSLFVAANFANPDRNTTVQSFAPLTVEGTQVLAKIVQDADDQVYLELEPQKALEFSDILIYWMPSQAQSDSIDDQAVLLGQLAGMSRRQFALQPGLMDASKQLVFYSRGQDQIIAAVSLETVRSNNEG